jgi:hypothetical protein
MLQLLRFRVDLDFGLKRKNVWSCTRLSSRSLLIVLIEASRFLTSTGFTNKKLSQMSSLLQCRLVDAKTEKRSDVCKKQNPLQPIISVCTTYFNIVEFRSRCYATTASWADILGPYLGNGSVNTFPMLGRRFLIMQTLYYNSRRAVFYVVRAVKL